jgi:hypothetical protein
VAALLSCVSWNTGTLQLLSVRSGPYELEHIPVCSEQNSAANSPPRNVCSTCSACQGSDVTSGSHRPLSTAPSERRAGKAPIRLALRRGEAAIALGLSDESFDRFVRPHIRVVRLGSLRLYAIDELRGFLDERASAPCDDIELS